MLLSIGLIVKNEEKYLERCLQALQPIRDALECELIIADTGSTDRSVEIAKKYADQFIEIEWRDDFAWARNQGLALASGEWFLYIDADEIFVETSQLINFFKMGEYKRYGSASLVYRNIIGGDVNKYYLMNIVRLCRLEEGVDFKNSIHEKLLPEMQPQKALTSYVNHWGYDFTDDPAMKIRKFERNLKPLLKEYEKHPESLALHMYIAREYLNQKMDDEAKFYLDEGLKFAKKNKHDILYHVLEADLMIYYSVTKQYEKGIAHIEEYLAQEGGKYVNTMEIYTRKAYNLAELERYQEAAEAESEAVRYYGINQIEPLDQAILGHVKAEEVNEQTMELARERVKGYYALAGMFEKVYEGSEPQGSVDWYNIFAVRAAEKNRVEDLAKLYAYLERRENITQREEKMILSAIEHRIDQTNKQQIAAAIVQVAKKETDYVKLQRMRLAFNKQEDVLDQLTEMLEGSKVYGWYFADLFVYGMAYDLDLGSVLSKIDLTDRKAVTQSLLAESETRDVLLDYVYATEFMSKVEDVGVLQIVSDLAKKILLGLSRDALANDTALVSELFNAYILVRHQYLQVVYRPEVYSEANLKYLYEEDAYVYLSAKAYEQKGAEFARLLREATVLQPTMKVLVAAVIENYLKDLDKFDGGISTAEQQELDSHIKVIKEALVVAVENDPEKAKVLLEAYKEINPKDEEIVKIEQQLS